MANVFEGQFECIGENKEKCRTFSVPIKKEIIKIDKDGNKTDETISSKIQFTDSTRFMTSSLSNLVNNLREGIHKTKCKDCGCFLEYLVIWQYINVYLATNVIQKSLMKA